MIYGTSALLLLTGSSSRAATCRSTWQAVFKCQGEALMVRTKDKKDLPDSFQQQVEQPEHLRASYPRCHCVFFCFF